MHCIGNHLCAILLSDYLGIDQVDDDENLTPYTREIWVPIFHIGHTKYILGMVIDQLQSQIPPSLSIT